MKLIQQKIHQIPKVELHSHLEGTIQPSLVKKIAKRNNIELINTDEINASKNPSNTQSGAP